MSAHAWKRYLKAKTVSYVACEQKNQHIEHWTKSRKVCYTTN